MTSTTNTWRLCKKITLTVARPLTRDDFNRSGGIIQTPEGPVPFRVGDYLGRDDLGEWPIKKATLESEEYQKVAYLSDGWATYQPCDIHEAMQLERPCVVNGLRGKHGDYKVRRGTRIWIVARAIFESGYRFLDEEQN